MSLRRAGTPALFALTHFLAAALLFSVEPMTARLVLPLLGGSPAVWTACMLFFQSALLAGYAYAHATTLRPGVRGQAVVHLAILLAAFLFVPFKTPHPSELSGAGPTWQVLDWLTRAVGLPFFAVAATAPLLQRWFATSAHPSARDPYFLYAASNAGSLAALVAYPLWVERRLRLGEQSTAWAAGLAVVAALVAVCAVVAALGASDQIRISADPDRKTTTTDLVAWVALALIPSSLMLGLTTYLTTDLAAIPLLWVVPLALYLLSFVVAFGPGAGRNVRLARRVYPFLVMSLAPALAAGLVQPFWMPLHVAAFFAAAVVCHGELARRRPTAARLTGFYLANATGGALGGVFNALVAPLVFDRVAEYPLVLVAACLVPAVGLREAWSRREYVMPIVVGLTAALLCANAGGLADSGFGVVATMAVSGLSALAAVYHHRRPVRFALTVGALLAASSFYDGVSGRVILRGRSFFGTLKVTEVTEGRVHRLFHGSTLHGQQSFEPSRRREPSTYFDRSGPIGQVFEVFNARPGRETARVAVTGLGAGSLACYARPGQRWSFAEIDPEIVRVARDPRFFTYLADSRASSLDIVTGDARLTMARADDGAFGLIVLDAFSSDAIPVHLLDREALALDRRKLAAGGLIAVNITNRYLDLAPVVALLARDAGLVCRVRYDPPDRVAEKATGKQGSIWAVLAERERDLGSLAGDPRWYSPAPIAGDEVWTDDFSNLFDHFRPVRLRGRSSMTGPSR